MYNCCSGSNYRLILGASRYDGLDFESLTVTSGISIVHEQYEGDTFKNDIAVVQLPSAVSFTSEYFHTVMNMDTILLIFNK
jgi:secreted trypsin-like serine protease